MLEQGKICRSCTTERVTSELQILDVSVLAGKTLRAQPWLDKSTNTKTPKLYPTRNRLQDPRKLSHAWTTRLWRGGVSVCSWPYVEHVRWSFNHAKAVCRRKRVLPISVAWTVLQDRSPTKSGSVVGADGEDRVDRFRRRVYTGRNGGRGGAVGMGRGSTWGRASDHALRNEVTSELARTDV